MNTLIHRTRRIGTSAALAAAITVGFAISPLGALAQETATTFTVSLDSLAPGVPQSITRTFTLEESAKLVDFTWVERSGVMSEDTADIKVTICDSNGRCTDAEAIEDSVFAAGSMEATLEVTLLETAPEGEAGSAIGELQFTQVVDDLPFTGLEITRLVVWGVAAISIGALALRLARQTRREES